MKDRLCNTNTYILCTIRLTEWLDSEIKIKLESVSINLMNKTLLRTWVCQPRPQSCHFHWIGLQVQYSRPVGKTHLEQTKKKHNDERTLKQKKFRLCDRTRKVKRRNNFLYHVCNVSLLGFTLIE